MRCAANRLVYPASTSPGLDASGVGISRSSPTSPVSASSCNRSPLRSSRSRTLGFVTGARAPGRGGAGRHAAGSGLYRVRSEEHTSELQSLTNLVCRLLLEKKKIKTYGRYIGYYRIT